jgi:carbon-monoxide dehydrogenase small subunit
MSTATRTAVSFTVNGTTHEALVEPRVTLADVLRDELGLTGTKVGCEQGVCGACTVLVDGEAVRSCLMLGVQATDSSITTVEGLSDGPALGPLQQAFQRHHALQCGFCTAGFLISTTALLADNPSPSREQIRESLSSSLCRCTGYQTIIDAVEDVAGAGS